MRRWEFDSITQASKSISSWFPGTLHERVLLRDHLDVILGIYIQLKCFPFSSSNMYFFYFYL